VKTITFNFFIVINTALAVWLGATGRVPWWTIVLIFMMEFKLEKKFISR